MFNRHNGVFSLIQWFFWSGFGIIFSYLTPYYQEIGFSSVQIGLFMGLASFANILGQLVLGWFADKAHSPGVIIRFSLLLGALTSLGLYLTPPVLAPVVILSFVLSFFTQSLPPLVDSWTMSIRRTTPNLDYGITRAMGSIGFAVTNVAAGILLDRWGLVQVFPMGAILMIAGTIIISLTQHVYKVEKFVSPSETPFEDLPEDSPPIQHPTKFFSPEMVSILPIFFLTFVAFRPTHVFTPILIQQLGGTNEQIGYSFAVMAISEVPFMVASTFLLKKFTDTKILFVAFIFYVFRIGMPAFAQTSNQIVLFQLFQGPSFGLFLPAAVHFMFRIAPEGKKTLAQTASSLTTFGIGSIAGSTLGGYMADWFGLRIMYGVSAGIMIVTLLLFTKLFILPKTDTRQASNPSTPNPG